MQFFSLSVPAKILVCAIVVLLVYGLYSYVRMRHYIDIGVQLVKDATVYEQHPENPTHRVLVLGDSSGVGVGALKPEDSVAGRFGALNPAVDITNIAVSGARFDDIATQLQDPRIQRDKKYDRVFLHIGGNDIVRAKSMKQVEKELPTVLDSVRLLSDDIVLIHGGNIGSAGIWPRPVGWWYSWRSRRANEIWDAAIAGDSVFTHANFYKDPSVDPFVIQMRETFATDLFHPGSEGYRIWFEEIARINKHWFFHPETATRAQWMEQIRSIDDIDQQFDCEDTIQDEFNGVQVQQVSDTGWLVMFTCRSFAYQMGNYAYYFDTNNNTLKQATRPSTEFLGEAPRQTVFSNDFTGFVTLSPNGVVQLYEKYAGHNGCGESGEYQWNNDTLQFDLVKLQQHEDCNSPLEPEQWPAVELN